MEDNEQRTSKYSSGVNIIMRVDQLWKDSHLHSRTGMFNAWNLDLDCIWSELSRDLKDKEDKKKDIKDYKTIKTEFAKFDEDILKHGKINDKEPEGFKKVTEGQIESRDKHYATLRKKQLFLARLENNLGKGTSWEEDDDDDIN